MVRSIADLREVSDERLIAEHDERAEHTYVGTQYYLDELRRRDTVRAQAASEELARRVYWLTVVNSVLAAVSAVTAIVAILLSH